MVNVSFDFTFNKKKVNAYIHQKICMNFSYFLHYLNNTYIVHRLAGKRQLQLIGKHSKF